MKDALWDERDDCLLCMPVGMFFVVVGGWLITLQQRKQKMQPLPQRKIIHRSSVDINYHLSINVMNSCPHTAMETKCYCVTTELSIKIYCHTYYANL